MADTETKQPDWLSIAEEAYNTSTSYYDTNLRKTWDDNLRHFYGRHAAGSKYNSSAYQNKSKVFRNKTRAAIRNNEAAGAAAFFANMDVVSVEPQNPDDRTQVASARINQELLTYRLGKTVPWFITCMGALQDAQAIGAVISKQDWVYEEREEYELETDETGLPMLDEKGNPRIVTNRKVVKDYPRVKLYPVENCRIDPGADWTDPIGTSPYVILLNPMYVGDIKTKMEKPDPKTGKAPWKKLSDKQIIASIHQKYDSTQMERTSKQEDRYDESYPGDLSDFEICWVHENFVRKDGEEWVYYTLGTKELLSDPVRLEEAYFHGERPIVMGCCIIETHKVFKSGICELGKNNQQELNEIANNRLDNVKLVLNKRYFVKRGQQVDLRSIVNNVAGSATLMNDPSGDVKPVDFNDVTSSSYQEQDRLNVDFDELIGTFSASTIQTNRKLNETVGGMEMLKGGVNSLVEYLLKTFTETWVEPVLRQLVKLEQKYETDTVVLQIAAQRAQIYQRFGIDQVTDELLNQELTTTVNVGMGATDPMMGIQKFLYGLNMIKEIMAEPIPGMNIKEIAEEIWGRLGYKTGERFFSQEEDPRMEQMQQIIQQLQQELESKNAELQANMVNSQADREARMMEIGIKEDNANKRKTAELISAAMMKQADLMNPVVGEKLGAARFQR